MMIRLAIALALAAVLSACQPTPTPPGPPPTPAPPTATLQPPLATCAPGTARYIMYERPGTSAALGVSETVVRLPEISARAVCLPEQRAAAIQAAGYDLQPDHVLRLIDPMAGEASASALDVVAAAEPLERDQWGAAKIRARDAQGLATGRGVTIAIIDTGVDATHPDLAGAVVLQRDYVGGAPIHGHGSHVAGIAAARVNNTGILGVAPAASIADYRVLDSSGAGYSSVIARAVLDAGTGPGVVINLSLGGPLNEQVMDDAIRTVIARGVVVVAAAGNEATDRPSYPGCSPGVIGVGATTQADTRAGFSNFGACIDIAAPGVDILSAVPGGAYEVWSGTSMAAPHVAGVAALVLSAGVAPGSVWTVLHGSGDPAPADIGGRRVNAWRAAVDAGAPPAPTITPRPPVTAPPTSDPYPGGTPTPGAGPASATPRATVSATATRTPAPPTMTAAPTATATRASSPTPTQTALPVPATVTPRPIPSLTPARTSTPCTIDAYTRVNGTPGYRPVYGPCLTPTATPRR